MIIVLEVLFKIRLQKVHHHRAGGLHGRSAGGPLQELLAEGPIIFAREAFIIIGPEVLFQICSSKVPSTSSRS